MFLRNATGQWEEVWGREGGYWGGKEDLRWEAEIWGAGGVVRGFWGPPPPLMSTPLGSCRPRSLLLMELPQRRRRQEPPREKVPASPIISLCPSMHPQHPQAPRCPFHVPEPPGVPSASPSPPPRPQALQCPFRIPEPINVPSCVPKPPNSVPPPTCRQQLAPRKAGRGGRRRTGSAGKSGSEPRVPNPSCPPPPSCGYWLNWCAPTWASPLSSPTIATPWDSRSSSKR